MHPVPRTIAFDHGHALDRATALFWKRGYAGTSLRDLLRVMGIGEGSFYNTLKSKKRLYLQCLDRYEQTEGRRRGAALLAAPTAGEGVRALFTAVLDCLDDPGTPSRLCMQAAMASEEVLADPELRRRVEADMAGFQAILAGRLRRDREAGLLRPGLDPEVTAAVVTTYCQGLWRMALVGFDRERFSREIDTFLNSLGL